MTYKKLCHYLKVDLARVQTFDLTSDITGWLKTLKFGINGYLPSKLFIFRSPSPITGMQRPNRHRRGPTDPLPISLNVDAVKGPSRASVSIRHNHNESWPDLDLRSNLKLFTFPTCDFIWDNSCVVLAVRNPNQKVSWSYELYRRRYSTSKIFIISLRNFRYPI